MKLWLLVLGMCLASVPGLMGEERISTLLRSMANDGPVPTEKVFEGTVGEDYVNQLSRDAVEEFLPLARALLRDPRPVVRRYGLRCFLAVTLRRSLDSQVLLEAYVPDLIETADDHASPLRDMALFVLGNTWPKVSPKTLAYLAAHLADKDNTPGATVSMACTLLKQGSDPLTRHVIAFVRKQNEKQIVEKVLIQLRLFPTENPEALSFIGSSLDCPNSWIRRRAVEAVAALPLADRSQFLERLSRLSMDPNEPTEIRSAADEALKK